MDPFSIGDERYEKEPEKKAVKSLAWVVREKSGKNGNPGIQ